jgi:hypothetical protein
MSASIYPRFTDQVRIVLAPDQPPQRRIADTDLISYWVMASGVPWFCHLSLCIDRLFQPVNGYSGCIVDGNTDQAIQLH